MSERREYQREYYMYNRGKLLARAKDHQARNREKKIEYLREYRVVNRDKMLRQMRANHYRRKYGLEMPEVLALLAGGCGICCGEATEIDHDHESGKVRGALCQSCNTLLGWFEKVISPEVRVPMEKYLAAAKREAKA